MKKIKVILGMFLCATVISTVVLLPKAEKDYDDPESEIEEMEDQIEDAEEAKKQLEESLSDVQELIEELEKEKTSLANYVVELDTKLAEIEDKISDLEGQIVAKETDIEKTQAQLVAAKEVERGQYEAMSSRIKGIYEQGTEGYIEILLQSKNPADLLNRLTYVEAMTEYDRDRLDEFIANKEYIMMCEKQLQSEKEHLDIMKACVESEQDAVETLIEAKSKEIEAFETDISNKEQVIAEYEAEIEEQAAIIAELEEAVEEAKKKLKEDSVIIYDGGVFGFPLETYTRISSDYGWRMHPTLNIWKFHNGVDFAAPAGTKIYAAYDGVVVGAAYNASMGNYVMIDHGSGLFTIYMHASKLYVAEGDIVIKGEHIAAVGSTGRSTGNHLHFSVRKDGEYVSPWEYLSE